MPFPGQLATESPVRQYVAPCPNRKRILREIRALAGFRAMRILLLCLSWSISGNHRATTFAGSCRKARALHKTGSISCRVGLSFFFFLWISGENHVCQLLLSAHEPMDSSPASHGGTRAPDGTGRKRDGRLRGRSADAHRQ